MKNPTALFKFFLTATGTNEFPDIFIIATLSFSFIISEKVIIKKSGILNNT